ncbi:hypothetical protein PGH12_04620 [Chryseobacterium wangxinyae]|uniref:hypothetical protein n=1 Tax=Chryseobacterium sp. CY350 TaxID=2997336 RepID=UPI00226FE11B|nr:hypothetical protein [Chryseobacterium sp. CY350]MCY0978664.1 hypothetical protein [Chryseobacterium sp. CY350]WBZ96433.1 hypothetical protein PGH12_04620 [Chryseobacterium sp. CY350]
MKIKYCILFLFLSITIFSQDKIELKEQCRLQYDSIFKKSFGERFFKKNIKYYKNKSSINVLTNDPNNEQYDNIFLNIENHSEIKKFMDKYPNFDYLEYYQYGFLYKGKPFHESTYTCETVNKKNILIMITNL